MLSVSLSSRAGKKDTEWVLWRVHGAGLAWSINSSPLERQQLLETGQNSGESQVLSSALPFGLTSVTAFFFFKVRQSLPRLQNNNGDGGMRVCALYITAGRMATRRPLSGVSSLLPQQVLGIKLRAQACLAS